MIVGSDASSLIAIAAVGRLDLLGRLYGEVIVPPAVWNEVTTPNRPGAGAVAGVLLEAKSRGAIPAVKPILDQMELAVAFRIKRALYDAVLRAGGE